MDINEEKNQEENIVTAETETNIDTVAENEEAVEEDIKKTDWKKELREWFVAILVAVVLALLIRNFVFTLVKVQGESMEPTLQNSDRLYVNRVMYKAEKGDVVIFVPKSDPKRPYVKRVIATEGDTVYIEPKTGDVYVNGVCLEEPYIMEKSTRMGQYIYRLAESGKYSMDEPIVIQPGHIFAMGDNRNNSKDSRDIGQVSEEEIIGGAVFRFWPLNNVGGLHEEATVSYMESADGVYSLG